MVTTHPAAEHGNPNAMPDDVDMGRAIVRGVLVGVPIVFVVLLAIELVAGMDPLLAAGAAILPAAIFGAFIGSAWYIGRASDAAHAAKAAARPPATAIDSDGQAA